MKHLSLMSLLVLSSVWACRDSESYDEQEQAKKENIKTEKCLKEQREQVSAHFEGKDYSLSAVTQLISDGKLALKACRK